LWFDEIRILGNYIEIRSYYFVKKIDFQGIEYRVLHEAKLVTFEQLI